MMSVSRGMFPAAAVLALGLFVTGGPVAAQPQGKADAVRITTVDGVELHGTFFVSPTAKA